MAISSRCGGASRTIGGGESRFCAEMKIVEAPLPSLLQLLIATPFAVLLHELAHAGMALALTRGKVLVVVGFGPAMKLHLGRLALHVSPLATSGCTVHRATRASGDRAI